METNMGYKGTTEKEVPMAKKLTGTVDEAAEAAGVSRNSAYEAVKKGEIPSIRIGKRILVLWGPFMRMLGAGDEEAA